MPKFLDDNGLLYLWGKLKDYFVKQVTGKGLSTNDLTNELKSGYDAAATHASLQHAPADAEKNVQADWAMADSGNDSFIKNKPAVLDPNTKGQPNGVASLDASGVIPSNQLPGFVDDVIELLGLVSTAPATCVLGDCYFNTSTKLLHRASGVNTWAAGTTPLKSAIYVDVSANGKSYRWGGTDMVMVTSTDLTALTNAEIDAIAV